MSLNIQTNVTMSQNQMAFGCKEKRIVNKLTESQRQKCLDELCEQLMPTIKNLSKENVSLKDKLISYFFK